MAILALALAGPAQAHGVSRAGRALEHGALAALSVPRPSVVLVNSEGQPIGGQSQQWVSQMRVPTISGPLVLEQPAALCIGGAAGCSQGAPASWYPGTSQAAPAIAATSRWSLYFELGHQFDFMDLTWRERGYLAWLWRVPGDRWIDSTQSIDQGGEDGLEAVFAYAYATCAETGDYFDSDTIVAQAPADAQPPAIRPRNTWGTCALIDQAS